MNQSAITQTETQPVYKGSWKILKKNMGIKPVINWLGTKARVEYDNSPYRSVLVGDNGNWLLSLVVYMPSGRRLYDEDDTPEALIEVLDYSGNEPEGYFSTNDFKEWLDKKSIQNRPHYRVADRQSRDLYDRVKSAEKRIENLNRKLEKMEANEQRAGVFTKMVSKRSYMDNESLKDALETFIDVVNEADSLRSGVDPNILISKFHKEVFGSL